MNKTLLPKFSTIAVVLAMCLQSFQLSVIWAQEPLSSTNQKLDAEQKPEGKTDTLLKGIMMTDLTGSSDLLTKQKVAADLKQRKNSVSGSTLLDVIVQPAGAWSSG